MLALGGQVVDRTEVGKELVRHGGSPSEVPVDGGNEVRRHGPLRLAHPLVRTAVLVTYHVASIAPDPDEPRWGPGGSAHAHDVTRHTLATTVTPMDRPRTQPRRSAATRADESVDTPGIEE